MELALWECIWITPIRSECPSVWSSTNYVSTHSLIFLRKTNNTHILQYCQARCRTCRKGSKAHMWCSWEQMMGASMMLRREGDSHLLMLFLKGQKNINKYRSLSCLGTLQIIQQAWFNFIFQKITHYTNLQKQLFRVIVTSSMMITSAKLDGKNNRLALIKKKVPL